MFLFIYNILQAEHTLNMELDLQSLFGLHVNSCTPQPLPLVFGLIYEGAIGQPDRRHLFVTPWGSGFCQTYFYHPYYFTAQIKRQLCLQNLIIISLNHHYREDQ
jgi:hypothetical protein